MDEAELHDKCVALYNAERKVGWDPSWTNAAWDVREAIEARVLAGEEAPRD